MFLAPFLPNRRPPTPWHVAPLLRYVAAMMTGIGAAWQGKEFIETKVWGLVALFSAILLLLHILINGLRKRRALTVGLSLLLIGVVSATWTQLDYEKTVFEWPSRPLYREGRVEHVQKRTKKGVQADLTIMVTENAERGRRVRAFIEDTCHTIVPGRQISFFVKVNKPQGAGNPGDFNYRDYLLTHRIGGTAYLPHAAWHVRKGVESTSLFQTFPSIRSLMLKSYADHFNADALAILSALTLGDKSLLTSEVKTLFSETGTSHVLALSGLHLGILFSLLNFFILARLKTYRFLFVSLTLLSIAGLWGFVALTGAPLSLQRAAWMFTIMQLAQCFRHTDVSSLNNLCIAAAILLISSPMSLLDVGFQLSFTAVLGISLANLYLWRRFPLPYWDYEADKLIRETPINLYSGYKRWFHRDTLLRLIRPFLRRAYNFFRHTIYPLITVSLSAQLATLPLVIYYFHVFSPLRPFGQFRGCTRCLSYNCGRDSVFSLTF